MKKCILITTLFIYFLTHLNAQSSTNLQGTITDNSSHGIEGALVHILNTNLQTTTNNEGRFTFNSIPPGRYTIEASAVGYAVATAIASTLNDNTTVIQLQPAIKQLDEVVVTAQKREETNQQLPISITALSSRKIADYRIWNTKD